MNKYVEYKLNNGKIQEIDYLKGFSISTIVLMHLLSFIEKLPSKIVTLSAIGGSGVHVFFLCSGIGLYLSYLNKKVSFMEFIKKRLIKIYIPYIFIVFISYLIPYMYIGNNRFEAFLSHVFMYKMFMPEFEESFGVQFWFVSTILQLYILFIPMCKVKEKINNNKIFLTIFAILSIMWWNICYLLNVADIRVWNSFCLQYIWEFAMGIIIADYLNNGKIIKTNRLRLLCIALVGICLQAGMAMFSDMLKLFNDIPALLGYGALALLLMNIKLVKSICETISKFSSELFLVHILVFKTVFKFVDFSGFIEQSAVGVVAFIIAIICAYIYSKLIKRVNISIHK